MYSGKELRLMRGRQRGHGRRHMPGARLGLKSLRSDQNSENYWGGVSKTSHPFDVESLLKKKKQGDANLSSGPFNKIKGGLTGNPTKFF